jgi:hypothetical protein
VASCSSRSLSIRALVFGLLIAGVFAAPAAEREYEIVIQGNRAGQLRVADLGGGVVATDLSYRDNGRGPDIRERFRVSDRGVPREYEASGASTFGAAISEKFSLEGGRARWQSPADRGDEAASPNTLFVPLQPSVAYIGQLVKSLAAQGGSAPAIGGATLSLERLTTVEVSGPMGKVPLALLAVTGADASPWYSWHRDDASLELIGVVWPGFHVLEKEYAGAVELLLKAQVRAEDDRLMRIQKRLARPLAGLTVIRGVRWFDAPAAQMHGPSDVYVFAGRIAHIGPPGELDVTVDQSIDGAGRTLLPGLFDMHGHIWSSAGPQYLAGGVTSVRELAGENSEILRLRDRIAAGDLPGPTIYPAGFIEGKSPYSSRNGFVVATVDEGKRAIDWYAARGYRQIKLYNSIRPEWVAPLAAYAKSRGMTVTGHVPAFMLAEQAVRDGYGELTHINQVMLNFVGQPGDDTRTLLRFTRVGDDAVQVDLNGPKVRAFVELLQSRNVVVDPTAGAFEAMLTQQQGQPNPSLVPIADSLPVLWRRNLKSAEMDLEGAKLATYRGSFQRMLDLVRVLHAAGIALVAGTDSYPGFGLHREMELYVAAGIPALEVLRIATWNGARVAGADKLTGSIEVGKAADLLLVDGDPSRNISDVRKTALVVRQGVAYSPAKLYEELGFKALTPEARIEPAARPAQEAR